MTYASSVHAASDSLRPSWLRPAARGGAALVHVLIVCAFFLTAREMPSSDTDAYDVAYVAEGEATQARAESAPDALTQNAESAEEQEASEEQQAEAPATKTPETQTPISMTKPDVVAPDALAVPLAQKPQEDQKPVFDEPREMKPSEAPVEKSVADGAILRQASLAADASAASAASVERVGVADGRNVRENVSRARYGARVLAEIQRHMFYPKVARSSGVRGDVVVVFTVGADGRMVERNIERSSGSQTLDAAALAMLDEVRAPPPPAGRFHGKSTIKFAIRH